MNSVKELYNISRSSGLFKVSYKGKLTLMTLMTTVKSIHSKDLSEMIREEQSQPLAIYSCTICLLTLFAYFIYLLSL